MQVAYDGQSGKDHFGFQGFKRSHDSPTTALRVL